MPAGLDSDLLSPIVRAIVADDAAKITGWSCRPLDYAVMAPQSGGLFVVSGKAAVGAGAEKPWSTVLKVATRPTHPGSPRAALGRPPWDNPAGTAYWKREAMAYASGLLLDLGEDFSAPLCYGVMERPGGDYWIWQEQVADDGFVKPWPLHRFAFNARHLGRFNGCFLRSRPLPALPWLNQDRVLGLLGVREPPVLKTLRAAAAWAHPLVAASAPISFAARMLDVWDKKDELARIANALPRTLCHGDTSCANLLTRRLRDNRVQTVAVDWAWLGIDHLGSDLAQLICGTLRRFEVPMAAAPDLVETVIHAYVEGLRDSGWQGREQDLKHAWIPSAIIHVLVTGQLFAGLDETRQIQEEALWRRSIEEIIPQRAAFLRFLLERTEEAVGLSP